MADKFLAVAKKAALEAGVVISKYSSKNLTKNIKGGDLSNFATQADIEAEKVIVKILGTHFPEHNIVGEEGTKIYKNSEYTWFIDPLDGTFTFGQKIPFFTVSIGLIKNDLPILGVINHVAFKNLYWAVFKKGAYLNDKRIHVSSKKSLTESAAVLEPGHKQNRSAKMDLYVNKLITKIAYHYTFGSAAVTLALVADASLDLYVTEAYPWDVAAGTILIREAGGKVTDFAGQEPDWSKERLSVVASNGLIHDQILESLI
ncbi:inositol monophosphatase [Candidatus Daviesbacteria bacterium]|nr:inositol monophosphatase [Candidatus Daviesbacteria bacterium]